jgi:hypothetical protein
MIQYIKITGNKVCKDILEAADFEESLSRLEWYYKDWCGIPTFIIDIQCVPREKAHMIEYLNIIVKGDSTEDNIEKVRQDLIKILQDILGIDNITNIKQRSNNDYTKIRYK